MTNVTMGAPASSLYLNNLASYQKADHFCGGRNMRGITYQKLTQRGQASVTLQPDSGLFNLLGAGVKLTTIKMDKTKQFNSLSFTFLFNQL